MSLDTASGVEIVVTDVSGRSISASNHFSGVLKRKDKAPANPHASQMRTRFYVDDPAVGTVAVPREALARLYRDIHQTEIGRRLYSFVSKFDCIVPYVERSQANRFVGKNVEGQLYVFANKRFAKTVQLAGP